MPKSNKKAVDNNKSEQKNNEKVTGNAKDNESDQKARRTKIASASWTGVLPCTILHNELKKKKWSWDYQPRRKGNEYFSNVFIINQDGQRFMVDNGADPTCKETPNEAKHWIATVALHKIAWNKNFQMMLPPQHRSLWLKLEEKRKLEKWPVDSIDPFAHRQNLKEAAETKKREIKVSVQKKLEVKEKFALKVGLAVQNRFKLEKTIKQYTRWHAKNASISSIDRLKLKRCGFNERNIDEALLYSATLDEALEWLIFHVPEEELASVFLPKKYNAGVTLISNKGDDNKNSTKLKWVESLHKIGYNKIDCSMAVDEAKNELEAEITLYGALLRHTLDSEIKENCEVWTEEISLLKSIFPDELKRTDQTEILIHLQGNTNLSIQRIGPYPNQVPLLRIVGGDNLPSNTRLAIIKKCGVYAIQNLIGEQMCFSIIEWIKENIQRIINDPGPLMTTICLEVALDQVGNVNGKKRSKHVYSKGRTPSSQLNDYEICQPSAKRQSLPAFQMRDKFCTLINSNQVIIVTGSTGSGKSTQFPQYILDMQSDQTKRMKTNIICTQPRRLAAISLAERVAFERGIVGCKGLIGYSTRNNSSTSKDTRLLFCTVGVLLQQLKSNTSLDGISHIVIDEVHERSIDVDLLLASLKLLLPSRKDLKLILMSATISASGFGNYFPHSQQINVPGKMYPVKVLYLDDIRTLIRKNGTISNPHASAGKSNDSIYFLIKSSVDFLHQQNNLNESMLIFVSGISEIERVQETLQTSSNAIEYLTLPLHASLSEDAQEKVFMKPPIGKRKIIVATNVAETSITIDDISIVIDSGLVKRMEYNPDTHVSSLVENFTSKAETMQRQGRAGRTGPGTCWKLWTDEDDKKLDIDVVPEIIRTQLEQAVLTVKRLGQSEVQPFLQSCLTPPHEGNINRAIRSLKILGALKENDLTALGDYISRIPIDPKIAKLLIHSTFFGYEEMALTAASILSAKSLFAVAPDQRDRCSRIRSQFCPGAGDLMSDILVYDAYLSKKRQMSRTELKLWCKDFLLSINALHDIAVQRRYYENVLSDLGIDSLRLKAINSDINRDKYISSSIAGCLYPNIAQVVLPDKKYIPTLQGAVESAPESKGIRFYTNVKDRTRVFLHPSSTLFSYGDLKGELVSFIEQVQTSKVFIKGVTPCPTLGMLLFCGQLRIDLADDECALVIGGEGEEDIKVITPGRVAVLVILLRRLLDECFAESLDSLNSINSTKHVDKQEQEPEVDTYKKQKRIDVITTVQQLIEDVSIYGG